MGGGAREGFNAEVRRGTQRPQRQYQKNKMVLDVPLRPLRTSATSALKNLAEPKNLTRRPLGPIAPVPPPAPAHTPVPPSAPACAPPAAAAAGAGPGGRRPVAGAAAAPWSRGHPARPGAPGRRFGSGAG